MIQISCKYCGKRISVPDREARQTLICPKCKGTLTVEENTGVTPMIYQPPPSTVAWLVPALVIAALVVIVVIVVVMVF